MVQSAPHSLFKVDIPRGFFAGILEAGFSIFVLLIAIRFFDAPHYCKAIIASGSPIGLMLSPVLLSVWGNAQVSEPRKCSILMVICSGFIFLASLGSHVIWFTLCILFAQICLSQIPSLMIRVYSELYSKKERGFRLSISLVLSTLGGMLSSYVLGKYLDIKEADPRIALWTLSCSALFCACFHFFMPKLKIETKKTSRFVRLSNLFKIPNDDRLFLRILIAWMILGFGVIMTFPLRIEYLANKDGLNFSNEQIALIGVSIFFICKVLSVLLCGKIFDRVHFMHFRIVLNLIMLMAILVYFNSTTFLGVAIGTAIAGIGTGGANIAWNLWVTKLAPRGKESDYMGVHLFLTGIRGSTAPFLGYILIEPLGYSGVSILSSILILFATLIFFTTITHPRFSTSSTNENITIS
ncbi:MAG: MFS transporter [Opitutales bacterium]|nr:MFS transporter [Opitutales bacterium]